MRIVRSIWVIRTVAGLFIASLLPLVVSPSHIAGEGEIGQSHAEWLQSRLRVEATDSFNQALSRVADEDFATQRDFLVAFVRAYEAEGPARSLAPLFTDISVSNDELILLLQGKLTGIGADFFTVPASLRAALAHVASFSSRDFAAQSTSPEGEGPGSLLPAGDIAASSSETAEGWLTSRQPHGP